MSANTAADSDLEAVPTPSPSEPPLRTSKGSKKAVQAAPAPDPEGDIAEIDRLDPTFERVKLSSGLEVDIEALKTRQFFKLLRIVTRGGANVLANFRLNPEGGEEEFVANLVGLVVFAIPEAEAEAIEFLRSMTTPVGLTGNGEKDAPLIERYFDELENPELEDTVSIIEAVVHREAPDLMALGKRLSSMLKFNQKINPNAEKDSSEGSA